VCVRGVGAFRFERVEIEVLVLAISRRAREAVCPANRYSKVNARAGRSSA